MAVITRWSYKRGGRKAGFHCIEICLENLFVEIGAKGLEGDLPNSHRNHKNRIFYLDILPKNLQIFASYGTHFINCFASLGFLCVRDAGHRGKKITVARCIFVLVFFVLKIYRRTIFNFSKL